jgi:hypothetical protein
MRPGFSSGPLPSHFAIRVCLTFSLFSFTFHYVQIFSHDEAAWYADNLSL